MQYLGSFLAKGLGFGDCVGQSSTSWKSIAEHVIITQIADPSCEEACCSLPCLLNFIVSVVPAEDTPKVPNSFVISVKGVLVLASAWLSLVSLHRAVASGPCTYMLTCVCANVMVPVWGVL